VVCNPEVKFEALLAWAEERDAAFVATGHYARVERPEGIEPVLLRGRDPRKEQSYFLHRLGGRVLSRCLFPLGGLLKEETRVMAASRGLPTRWSPESQEVCFLSGEDYRAFLERRDREGVSRSGPIVDTSGRRLGRHRGVFRYTVGQRRGLGIASEEPYYVVALRPERREVVAGRREELLSRRVEAESFFWTSGPPRETSLRGRAQVRYRHAASSGRLERLEDDRARFLFERPQRAVTPGQALVCYDGDRVLGGGWIVSAS
jgi:tRNA-specific 2-thiouridylase